MSDGYDLTTMSREDMDAERAEQDKHLKRLNVKLAAATDPDAEATIESEILSGFELCAALDAEIERRATE